MMDIREIFDNALDITDPERRSDYLDQACGNDREQRQQIEELLEAQQQLGSFLQHPAVEAVVTELVSEDNGSNDAASGDTLPELDTQALSFLAPSENPEALGILGQYEILEIIGRGGMGLVFKARDLKIDRIVAVKVLAPEIATNAMARKRFLREAQTAGSLSHDHIVTIHAVEEDTIPFLVMEFIDGKSLQQKIIEEGQLELKEIVRIARQVAAGLAAAHEQGLIHRDIKPSNILLQNGIERVQITDFGLARAMDDLDVTKTGEIAGTPQYMSPEQAKSEPLDQRSDLFSLGSVIYAMCAGRSPFRAETTYAAIKRVCEDEPRSLRENNPEIPTWIEAIIFKLLEKNPEDRFQTAQEVADLLAKHLAHLQDPGSTPFPLVHALKRPAASFTTGRQRWLVAGLILLALTATFGVTEATSVTNLSRMIVRIATGEGTLEIQTDDPGLQITVSGDDETVTIRGGGVQQLTLPLGDYQVAAIKNGAPVKQELATITRNGRTVVRMILETDRAMAGPAEKPQPIPFQWPADTPAPAIAPFDAKQARQQQRAWATHLGVQVENEIILGKDKQGKDVTLTMVLIPPGEFMMGTSDEVIQSLLQKAMGTNHEEWYRTHLPREKLQHKVILTHAVYMSKYELTRSQFRQFIKETDYLTEAERSSIGGQGLLNNRWVNDRRFTWDNDFGTKQTENHPVVVVSWNDANEFCNWLSKKTESHFRLPTEAEWEFACRAGEARTFSFGDDPEDMQRYSWSFPTASTREPQQVGGLLPNSFGLHDMHGNVWEWCHDAYASYGSETPRIDPQGPEIDTTDQLRVMRGGSFNDSYRRLRSANRNIHSARSRFTNTGFRIVRAIESQKTE